MRTKESLIRANTLLRRFNRMLGELKVDNKMIATAYLDEWDLTVLRAILTDYVNLEEERDD